MGCIGAKRSVGRKWSGAEEMLICGKGREFTHLQGIQHLWAPPGDSDFLPIPWVGDIDGV